MAKIPARQFVEKLAEKVNARTDIIKNFVQQLSDEGKLTRYKLKNRWHFDDDDLYSAYTEWLFSNQFISSIENELNALPNNSWEKIRLLLLKISEFNFVPLCQPYGREFSIGTINKENRDMAKFLLDLIDRLERHLLEGSSDTCLQFRPPSWYQGYCRAFGTLTGHLGGCYTSTHDLNKFCYTQNALAEFVNGRFTSKAVDFDIFLRHFGLNVDDFILPINEDKDKFFDDRPPIVPNTVSSVPAPVETSIVTSHGDDTVGKKISLQTLTQATTNLKTMEDCNMKNSTTQINFSERGNYRWQMADVNILTRLAQNIRDGYTEDEAIFRKDVFKLCGLDYCEDLIHEIIANDAATPAEAVYKFLAQYDGRIYLPFLKSWQKFVPFADSYSLVAADDCKGVEPPEKILEPVKTKSPVSFNPPVVKEPVPMPKGTSIHDVDTYTDADNNIETAAQIVGTEEQPPKKSHAKSSPKISKPKSSTRKPKPKEKPTVADSSTTTEEQPAPTSNSILRTCDYIADCPANLNIPNDFHFSNKGILYEAPAKKEGGKKRFVCVANLPIVPTKAFREVGTNITTYEVAIKKRNKWWRTTVDGRTLQDPRRVLDLANDSASIEEPKLLAKFFARILIDDNLPEIQAFNKPGWHNGEFIYPTGGDDYICRRQNIDYTELFGTRGDANAWKQKFREFIASGSCGSIKRGVFGAALSAPALKVLHVPNFSVHLLGKYSYAKTPTLKFPLSVFGNPSEGALLRSWDSTAKNRTAMAAGLCDFPQGLDELESLGKKAEEELSKNVYDFVTGIVNQSNQRSGDVKQAEKFRGVRLSTGERPLLKITDKGGAYKRVITLRASQPLFDNNTARDLHIFCERNHGHFGRTWIQYILEHQAELVADFDRIISELNNSERIDTSRLEDTHIRAIAACVVSFYHFRIAINLDGTFADFAAKADAESLLSEMPTKDEMSDTKRGIDLLTSYVNEHPKNFINAGEKSDTAISALSFTETSGVIFADGRVGIFPNAFRRIVEEELHLPSYEKFLNELFDEDKIICPNRREKAKLQRIGGIGVKRLYLFKAGVLAEANDEQESESTVADD